MEKVNVADYQKVINENDLLKRRIESLKESETKLKQIDKQLSLALLNSQKHEKEITELLQATHGILKHSSFTVTARNIFDACSRTIGAKAGYVALLSDDGSENELLFLEDGGMPCTVNPELPMPIRGLREVSYKTGKVVYDNEFMKSEWVKFMPGGHMDLPNVLFSPLNIEGKTVGIMGMACKEGDFNENDARIAAAFGDYAAIALQNSRNLEKLNEYARKLEELNSVKDKMLSIMSHDLKSPYSSILGFSEILKIKASEENPQEVMRIAGIIHDAISQNYNLLNNLLTWTRAQAGYIEFNPQKVALQDLFQELSDNLDHQQKQKNISLNYSLGLNEIYADRNMLSVVFRNLISNAIKYSFPDSAINIEVNNVKGVIQCSISDTGVGIEPDRLTDMHENNTIQSTRGTAQEKGTGFGLMICKEFVYRHGGKLWAESEPGHGSTFYFTIPTKM